jgi:phenylacetate-CoA ligase
MQMTRSRLAFKLLGYRYGFDLDSFLRLVNDDQYWSKTQITEYQTKRMIEIIRHSYENVPFYRQYFDSEGLTPEQFTSLTDLNKLPIIRKQDVHGKHHEFLAKNHAGFQPLDRATGGTTGLAFKFYNDTQSWGLNWATKIRTFSWGGYKYGEDKVAVMAGGSLLPEGKFEAKSRFWRFLNNYLVLPITIMTDEIMESYRKKIIRQRIRFLRGYPSAIYTFAQYLSSSGKSLPMQSVFTTAEMLLEHQRLLLEKVFCCKVFDTYGCGDGMGGANECEVHNGLHINIETSFLQIVRPDGIEAKPGETGEIVLTALHEYAMPLIRYAPGDMAELGEGICSCGRTLPLIKKIVGRTTDLIELANGRKLNGLSIPFETWTDTIDKFQIVQTQIDQLVVNIIPKTTTTEHDLQTIKARMQFFAGEGIDVIVNRVESIPLPKSGKMRYVVSKIDK